MRQDQYDKLQALEEKLTDVFLGEADPDTWPGQGLDLATVDAKTRGDRYWSKKNAVATLSLIQRVGSLVHTIQVGSAVPPPAGVDPQTGEDEKQLDGEIASAEKEANRLLDELQKRSRKTEFDQRTNGKS
jgi:hypothetical protein